MCAQAISGNFSKEEIAHICFPHLVVYILNQDDLWERVKGKKKDNHSACKLNQTLKKKKNFVIVSLCPSLSTKIKKTVFVWFLGALIHGFF
jgi:hypothetical protein